MRTRKRKSYAGMKPTYMIGRRTYKKGRYARAPPLGIPMMFPALRGWAGSRSELKYLDSSVASEASTTGELLLLNGLSLGNTAITRVGQQVSIKSLQITGRWANDQAVPQAMRIMVFIDKQANGAAPAVTDLLNSVVPTALRNLAWRKRFNVIVDKFYSVGGYTAAVETNVYRVVKMYIKFKRPLKVEYNTGNNGNIQDIAANSLYWCVVGNQAAPGGCPFVGNARIRFYDS